jgi:hypothetical protein
MYQSPIWKADSGAGGQEAPLPIRKSTPLDPILSQTNPAHSKIHFNIIFIHA